jgi:serine/threonine protein kinase/Tol biopolymer transport system component
MERWKEVEMLFHAALAQPWEQRSEFLRQASTSDPSVRDEVLSLLKRANDDSFLKSLSLALPERAARVLVGQMLGNFEVLALIGRGGMGEVYRARDKRLNREVAIKVAGVAFSDRFEQEGRAVAGLNHPNICTLYDIGPNYLVMELVEGPTLADKIKTGPLALDETLTICGQIAEALEVAHERGIVHRDLKPANIKIKSDGTVKVLDFGLATTSQEAILANAESTPAVTTYAGVVAGTPAYMSPEQASGRLVDKRADIWSFGVIFWEMLTGKRLFGPGTLSDTLGEVLRAEIVFSALPQDTPATIRDLLGRCLDRNPKTRLRDIGEARVSIEKCRANPAPIPAAQQLSRPGTVFRKLPTWIWAAAGVAILLAVLGALFFFGGAKSLQRPAQWRQITDFPDSATAPALSPDGRMLAFTVGNGWFMRKNEIYVKILPDGPAIELTHDGGTKAFPSFSPDGLHLAYTVGAFNTSFVPVFSGGTAQPMLQRAAGLTWTNPYQILFSELTGKGMAIETALENRAKERQIYLPEPAGMAHFSSLSPDRKQVLVVEMPGTGSWGPCRLVPFDGGSKGHQVGPIPAQCNAAAWSPDGKWMYFTADTGHGSHVWRQRTDNGKPEQLTFGPTEEQGLAIAPDGKSLFTSVGSSHASVWVHDAAGDRQISQEGSSLAGFPVVVSPDGARVYYMTQQQLWAVDLKTGQREQVAPGASVTAYNLSPDGKFVIYGMPDDSTWMAATDRRSLPRRLPLENSRGVQLSRSGRLYFTSKESGATYLYSMTADGRDRRKALARPTDGSIAEVSPDERWAMLRGSPFLPSNFVAWPLNGGPPLNVCRICSATWSKDGKSILFIFSAMRAGASATVAVPLKNGAMFPQLP